MVVALALDGDPLAGDPSADEIDADISTVEAGQALPLGPVRPTPNRIDLEFGLLQRKTHEQLLEPAALLGLISALGTDAVEDNSDARPAAEIEAHLWMRHAIDPSLVGSSETRADRLRQHYAELVGADSQPAVRDQIDSLSGGEVLVKPQSGLEADRKNRPRRPKRECRELTQRDWILTEKRSQSARRGYPPGRLKGPMRATNAGSGETRSRSTPAVEETQKKNAQDGRMVHGQRR